MKDPRSGPAGVTTVVLVLVLKFAALASLPPVAWLALLLAFWALYMPHKVGMVTAWCLGLVEDVVYGTLLGQNALILTLITFLVLSLQQRLRMFPMWQQSLVLLVIFGLAQLAQLWLSALTGNRQPTLALVLPALVSALLWPWVSYGLRGLVRRFKIN